MNRTLIIGAISIGVILILIISFIVFMIYYTNNNIKDKGGMVNERMNEFPLQRLSYDISGDSIGSYISKEIQHFEDYDVLTITSKASINAETVTKEYVLPNDTLLAFTNIISRYDYKNWNNLPQSDNYALDAGIQSITIQFPNNEFYSINQYKVLPKSEENLFEIVIEFLNENIKIDY